MQRFQLLSQFPRQAGRAYPPVVEAIRMFSKAPVRAVLIGVAAMTAYMAAVGTFDLVSDALGVFILAGLGAWAGILLARRLRGAGRADPAP